MNQGYPKHPGRVLASAQYAGLAALVRLAKRRVTREVAVQNMFAGIDRMWRDARAQLKIISESGQRDLTALFNVEPNMRKNFLGMHWYSTVPYGNREFKRVYQWSEGTIGPLNEMYNFSGSQLRSLAMTCFPFPRPSYYQIREYPDGTSRVLSLNTVKKNPVEEKANTRWIALYPGNGDSPDVRVRHPTLPELDFVDMIRAHVYELCRQCFIHSVPEDAAHRYIRLLIHQLTPFLEWKYTEEDSGRKDFWPQADQELRKIVFALRTYYSQKSGRTPRLTHQLTDEQPERVTINELEDQAERALAKNHSKEMEATVKILQKHIAKKNITDNDAASLVDDALKMSAVEGNRWHTLISNNGYQPNSLREVVFHGDEYHRELNDILLAYEVPVTTSKGLGVADIVVFVRRVFGESAIWIPVMVLDNKTRTQLDWTFYSKMPRTKKKGARVFVHDIKERPFSNEEWDSVLDCIPTPVHESQLAEYEKGIISEFEEIVHDKEVIPKSLWKGIIALDSVESYKAVVEVLPWFVRTSMSDLEEKAGNDDSRILYTLDPSVDSSRSLHLALIILSKDGPFELLQDRVPLTELAVENPFEQRITDDRSFTLYLTVASSGASGESAAWSARNWHLLQYLRQLADQSDYLHIVWLDLMGYYPSIELAISRFRVTGALNSKGLTRRFLQELRNLVKSIEFVNLNDELKSYFFEEKRAALKRIHARLDAVFSDLEREQIVIVDGCSELRETTPSTLKSLAETLERRLIEWLPKKSVEILWLDRPIPLPTRSFVYQRPEVSPLTHNSFLREHLDMIIWNKPTPPRFLGWRSPVLEYVRVIEEDTPTQAEPFSSLFLVPTLHGWGRRFRANSSQGRKLTERDVMELVHGPKYARGYVSSAGSSFILYDSELQENALGKSLELSPSILRPRTDYDETDSALVRRFSSRDFMLSTRKMGQTKSSLGILDRLTLVPAQKPLQRTRWNNPESKQYYPADAITRPQMHKERGETERREKRTRRPPLLEVPHEIFIDEAKLRQEILRISRTARFLRKRAPSINQDWRTFLFEIIKECESCPKTKNGKKKPIDVLEDVRNLLTRSKESKEIWMLLSDIRRTSLQTTLISATIRDAHIPISSNESELWEMFGNDLYLMILAIFWDEALEIDKSNLEILWSAFSDWQFVHMGFTPHNQPETHVKSKYDVSAIWSNLRWRARQLTTAAPAVGIFESHRFGLLVQVEDNCHWLIFQNQSGFESMVAGFTESVDAPFRWKWYECSVDPLQLDYWSGKSWDNSMPIVITRIENKDILWTPRMDDDRIIDWWAEGVFEYGPPPEGKIAPMRWFRLSRIPDSLRTHLVQPEVTITDELEDAARYTLEQLEGYSDRIKQVNCIVTVDSRKGAYVIRFFDKRNLSKASEPVYSIDIKNTTDLIETLRHPKLKGTPFKNELWWSPESDVEFSEVKTASGPISMTFLKPFLYRSRGGSDFLKAIHLPRTASNLLQTKLGESITLVADPNLKLLKHPLSRHWRILFLQGSPSERMLALQSIDVDIIEVAQFFESQQFVDATTELRHPLKFTINNVHRASFPSDVFRYNNIATFLNEREISANEDGDS